MDAPLPLPPSRAPFAALAAHAPPVLASFFAALASPDPRWLELATLVTALWHHATSRDRHRATTVRLGRLGVGVVVLVPVRVSGGVGGVGGGIGGCGVGGRKVRRRVRRPVGVGRGR
jgi:hypothetical protein